MSRIRFVKRLSFAVILFSWAALQLAYGHQGQPIYIELQQIAADSSDSEAYDLSWRIPSAVAEADLPLITPNNEQCTSLLPQAKVASRLGRLQLSCRVASDSDTQVSLHLAYPESSPQLTSLVRFTDLQGQEWSAFSPASVHVLAIPKKRHFETQLFDYLKEGVAHILEGYDHLLFVFCLMIIAGTAKRIAWVVTGFTAAHSVTLAAATLGWVSLRIDLVEILIALSIVFLAAEVYKGVALGKPNGISWRYPFAAAFAIGLLHGLGFASALSEVGLPADSLAASLLLFNLGIELGQLSLVLVVFSSYWLVVNVTSDAVSWGRWEFRPNKVLIYAVGLIAAYWFVERLVATVFG